MEDTQTVLISKKADPQNKGSPDSSQEKPSSQPNCIPQKIGVKKVSLYTKATRAQIRNESQDDSSVPPNWPNEKKEKQSGIAAIKNIEFGFSTEKDESLIIANRGRKIISLNKNAKAPYRRPQGITSPNGINQNVSNSNEPGLFPPLQLNTSLKLDFRSLRPSHETDEPGSQRNLQNSNMQFMNKIIKRKLTEGEEAHHKNGVLSALMEKIISKKKSQNLDVPNKDLNSSREDNSTPTFNDQEGRNESPTQNHKFNFTSSNQYAVLHHKSQEEGDNTIIKEYTKFENTKRKPRKNRVHNVQIKGNSIKKCGILQLTEEVEGLIKNGRSRTSIPQFMGNSPKQVRQLSPLNANPPWIFNKAVKHRNPKIAIKSESPIRSGQAMGSPKHSITPLLLLNDLLRNSEEEEEKKGLEIKGQEAFHSNNVKIGLQSTKNNHPIGLSDYPIRFKTPQNLRNKILPTPLINSNKNMSPLGQSNYSKTRNAKLLAKLFNFNSESPKHFASRNKVKNILQQSLEKSPDNRFALKMNNSDEDLPLIDDSSSQEKELDKFEKKDFIYYENQGNMKAKNKSFPYSFLNSRNTSVKPQKQNVFQDFMEEDIENADINPMKDIRTSNTNDYVQNSYYTANNTNRSKLSFADSPSTGGSNYYKRIKNPPTYNSHNFTIQRSLVHRERLKQAINFQKQTKEKNIEKQFVQNHPAILLLEKNINLLNSNAIFLDNNTFDKLKGFNGEEQIQISRNNDKLIVKKNNSTDKRKCLMQETDNRNSSKRMNIFLSNSSILPNQIRQCADIEKYNSSKFNSTEETTERDI